MNPDFSRAERFLSLLDSHAIFTFQTFADPEEEDTSDIYPQVLHGTFEEHAPRLESLNNRGSGIYVMVNAGDGLIKQGAKTCRTAENVVRVRAFFVDLDGSPIGPVITCALPPDWIVQSSPDRWHAYWRVDDCPLDQFALVQAGLCQLFGGDPSVKDLPRVMRVPGFYHRKAEPFLSELYLPEAYPRLLEVHA